MAQCFWNLGLTLSNCETPVPSGVAYCRAHFTEYCWSFYGPGEVHGDFFNHALRRDELDAAVRNYIADPETDFAADSIDREHVRDILLGVRKVATS